MGTKPLWIATGLHSPQLGGSQVCTLHLAGRLRSRGHDVKMFGIDQELKTSVLPLAKAAGFDVEILPAESSIGRQAARIRNSPRTRFAGCARLPRASRAQGRVALALRTEKNRAQVVTNWMMENHRWIPPDAPLIVGFELVREEAAGLQRDPVWLVEPAVAVDADQFDDVAAATFRVEHGIDQETTLVTIITRADRDMKLDSIL